MISFKASICSFRLKRLELFCFSPPAALYCSSLFQQDTQASLLADSDLLESILLETLRLYPPFLGGRRIISEVRVICPTSWDEAEHFYWSILILLSYQNKCSPCFEHWNRIRKQVYG